MQYFWHWAIKPLLRDRGVKSVLEIGSCEGGMPDRLVEAFPGMRVSVVDLCINADLETKFKDVDPITFYQGYSLKVLPKLQGPFDAIFIDGDHNYYTVWNELKLIDKHNLLKKGGLLLFHDVRPPFARKDYYYDPESIPEEAKAEGAKKGVLTAIEDFKKASSQEWIWLDWRAQHGLGCLTVPRSSSDRVNLKIKKTLWMAYRWQKRALKLIGRKPKV